MCDAVWSAVGNVAKSGPSRAVVAYATYGHQPLSLMVAHQKGSQLGQRHGCFRTGEGVQGETCIVESRHALVFEVSL